MAHIPPDILRELICFHDRIEHLFEERLRGSYQGAGFAESAAWSPATDIHETAESFVLTAELPGVELGDIRIEVVGNELVLSGRRSFPREGLEQEDYQRLEGNYGPFERRFTLPAEVNRDRIGARLKDGVLRVTVPKLPGHRVTEIAIRG